MGYLHREKKRLEYLRHLQYALCIFFLQEMRPVKQRTFITECWDKITEGMLL